MTTNYAVEIYFDPTLENQVLKAWNVLSLRQITSKLIEMESRPHITLLCSPFLDSPKVVEVINNFACRQQPLPITFSSIGSFPRTGGDGLFLSPIPSTSLLLLQMQLCDELKKVNVEIGELYCPDSWIPHCVVAEDIPKNRLAEALCILQNLKLPISGSLIEIGLVDFSSARHMFSLSLKGDSSEE